jgi:hypothetical protein
MAHSLLVRFEGVPVETVTFLAGLLTRRLNERCSVPVRLDGNAEMELSFRLDAGLGEEGYRVADELTGGLVISSGGPRGLLYGLGKFLRDAVYGPGEINPGSWRGESHPAKAVRGIYFATHFHNFYHDAPLEEVERYVEELGLWGTNALTVWFDLHHYNSIQDPDAQAMIVRLHTILAAARRAGLMAGLLVLGNEGYASSPLELRADWTPGHDGCFKQLAHYHVEVCPSKPGGLDLILKWHREVFEAFADIRLDFVWIWPHDQGGCSCADCAPWGGNGFLRVARPTAQLARDYFPQARLILSTWYFDTMIEGEWKTFDQAMQSDSEWVDYIMAEFPGKFPDYILQNGVPAGLPLLGFPEISMFQSAPWGGFGANPLPRYIEAMWKEAGAVLSGGFPYSEGIFEDINKAVVAWYYWNGGGDPIEAVREYANLEYSSQAVEKITRAIFLLETSNRRVRQVGQNPEWMSRPGDPAGDEQFIIANPGGIETAFALLEEVDRSLAADQRQAWRWRVLYLRGLIDLELSRNEFRTNPRIEQAYEELIRIYSAEDAIWAVRPPAQRNRHLTW